MFSLGIHNGEPVKASLAN